MRNNANFERTRRVSSCRQNRLQTVQNQEIQRGQRSERKRRAQLEDQNEETSTIESQAIQVSYFTG